MPGLALTVLAQLVAASTEVDGRPPRDPAAVSLALAEARASYTDVLAHSDFCEDAPAVRALAETLTPLLVEAWSLPALRTQAVELMQATAAEGLRPFFASHPGMLPSIARAWVRWHDDGAVVTDLPPTERGPLLRVLALHRPDRAAALLGPALRDADPAFGRDGVCHTALLLPDRARRVFLEGAIPAIVSQAPRDNWPACIRLSIEHPVGRAWLRAAVLDPRSAPAATTREHWAPMATALLATRAPRDPAIDAQLSRWAAHFRGPVDAPARREMVTALERQSPGWPATAPDRRAPLIAFVRALGSEAVRVWPLRRALGDRALFPDALLATASPSIDPATLAAAVRVVGLTAPVEARGRAAAVEALDLLRSRLRPWGIDSVSPREIDRWRAALEEARPCLGARCAESLEAATDPLAARTVALGAPLDDADVARVVVRRVVTAGEDFFTTDGVVTTPSALAAVVLTRAAGCPAALRGLATARPAVVGRARSSWLDPWRERVVARCTAEARRP